MTQRCRWLSMVGFLVLSLAQGRTSAHADFLYYSDNGLLSPNRSIDHIKRANTDGTGVQTILTNTNRSEFGGIAFNQSAGFLYSGDFSSIFRANLDGTNRVNLAPSGGHTGDVELDLVNNKIYWTVAASIPRVDSRKVLGRDCLSLFCRLGL